MLVKFIISVVYCFFKINFYHFLVNKDYQRYGQVILLKSFRDKDNGSDGIKKVSANTKTEIKTVEILS